MRTWHALVALAALPALVSGQSLGDAARKERERREGLKKAGTASRTVTEEDLATTKGAVANASATEPEPGEAEAEGKPQPATTVRPFSRALTETGSGAPAPAGGEAYWRGRVATARARIEEARRAYQSFQRKLDGRESAPSENGQEMVWDVHKLKAVGDAAEAELKAAEKALEDLLEEARHAGALPGWLR